MERISKWRVNNNQLYRKNKISNIEIMKHFKFNIDINKIICQQSTKKLI